MKSQILLHIPSCIYIYGNDKTLISHHGCSYYLVITGKKGANHILHNVLAFAFLWCIFLTSNLSQQQFFLHNNSVTLQNKQSTKSLLYNFNFLNDYTKIKRNNVLSSNQKQTKTREQTAKWQDEEALANLMRRVT